MQCLLGEIADSAMILSPAGEIVHREWNKSFDIRKELSCDVFVIMPNHIHAILRIAGNAPGGVQTPGRASVHGRASLRSPQSISSFVAGFKSTATKQINELQNTPGVAVWQTRFYDHIIRDDDEYRRTADYIINNPREWEKDKFYDQQKPSENRDAENCNRVGAIFLKQNKNE
jgi:REP element-mobilizing transposase RayT